MTDRRLELKVLACTQENYDEEITQNAESGHLTTKNDEYSRLWTNQRSKEDVLLETEYVSPS